MSNFTETHFDYSTKVTVGGKPLSFFRFTAPGGGVSEQDANEELQDLFEKVFDAQTTPHYYQVQYKYQPANLWKSGKKFQSPDDIQLPNIEGYYIHNDNADLTHFVNVSDIIIKKWES